MPTEAFGGARRALSHLRSRMEEVCREEVDKISRAGMVGPRSGRNPSRKKNLKPLDAKYG